ncbi:hypothetical protein Leryth_024825 [Lithospermum erythrorhizon]|nr:hypothetical protein Leryth_024825 [Lithospermum erythrorhizon]
MKLLKQAKFLVNILANVVNLRKELMYQQVLRRFVHFNAIQLCESPLKKNYLILVLKGRSRSMNLQSDDLPKRKLPMWSGSGVTSSSFYVVAKELEAGWWDDEKHCFQTVAASLVDFLCNAYSSVAPIHQGMG